MNDDQLLRYSRHILLDEVGIEGQQRLLDSHVLVVGAGGLGSAVALYLAASGVGHITLADPDVVDLTNLQRQIAHTTARVGQAKVHSATQAMHALNPEVRITALPTRLDAAELRTLVTTVQLVVDGCDNFQTRQAVNAACVAQRVPLVSGAAIRLDGQLAVYDARDAASPCYACVFPPDSAPEEAQCASMGVLAPLVGVVGSMQAMEALKLLLGMRSESLGQLQLLDGRSGSWHAMRVQRNPRCPVCAPQHA